MKSDRETIYAAIFALVSGCAPFAVTSRRLVDWADAQAQPALYQIQKGEDAQEGFPGLPIRWMLHVQVFVYAKGDGTEASLPSAALNPLVQAIDNAIAPPAGSPRQTLGGLVEHVWIDGRIEIFEGVLGNQAVAIVPISALTRG